MRETVPEISRRPAKSMQSVIRLYSQQQVLCHALCTSLSVWDQSGKAVRTIVCKGVRTGRATQHSYVTVSGKWPYSDLILCMFNCNCIYCRLQVMLWLMFKIYTYIKYLNIYIYNHKLEEGGVLFFFLGGGYNISEKNLIILLPNKSFRWHQRHFKQVFIIVLTFFFSFLQQNILHLKYII